MNKIEFMRLWDAYSGLLTPTQREITGLYFNLDLTLSEIAEQKGISRQAVSDCLSGCKKQLEEWENKLKFVNYNTNYGLQVSFMVTDAERWVEDFKAAHPDLSGEVEALEKILSKDYSAEVSAALADPNVRELMKKDFLVAAKADEN